MGLLDGMLGQLASSLGGSDPQHKNLVNGVFQMLSGPEAGGLGGIVKGFESSGLANLVQSWVSTGENLPATGQQIEQGLGVEKIMGLAQSLGLTPDVVKAKLAEILPQVIDKLTPDGAIPAELTKPR
jgi:uncharacterized protein YidB (DUF937 family)